MGYRDPGRGAGLPDKSLTLVQPILLPAWLTLALVLGLLAYFFIIAGAVVGLAHLAGIPWVWMALAVAGAFVISLIVLLAIRIQRTKQHVRNVYLVKERSRNAGKSERNVNTAGSLLPR
jgi:cell division protein FtsW (lipid II flippase)